jgi:hypothetical protein
MKHLEGLGDIVRKDAVRRHEIELDVHGTAVAQSKGPVLKRRKEWSPCASGVVIISQ